MLFLEDIEVGTTMISLTFTIERNEMDPCSRPTRAAP